MPKWHFYKISAILALILLAKAAQTGYNDRGECMKIRDLRKANGLTQVECAKYLGISLRSYKRYESDETAIPSVKKEYIISKLGALGKFDETHGVLSVETIKKICAEVFANYAIEYCYLFGSYAKGKATTESDIDLLVDTETTGLAFYGLIEALREALGKKVDVLNQAQIKDNFALTQEILKEGIKIYG